MARDRFEDTQLRQRRSGWVGYAAGTWTRPRQIIVKAEHTAQGSNPGFVVTTLEGDPQDLYDRLYCARGGMENRIKEQFQLFSDRTSCHRWWPSQFRLPLSSCAYALVDALRRLAPQHTALARAQINTLRPTLFKIGAAVVRNTRRIRFLMSSNDPGQTLFATVVATLNSG